MAPSVWAVLDRVPGMSLWSRDAVNALMFPHMAQTVDTIGRTMAIQSRTLAKKNKRQTQVTPWGLWWTL